MISELNVYDAGSAPSSTEESRIYAFPIAIVRKEDGTHTWRGEGQYLPAGTLVGVASLYFEGDDDRYDEWPLSVGPIAVVLHGDMSPEEFARFRWESHSVEWNADYKGRICSAQFQHAR